MFDNELHFEHGPNQHLTLQGGEEWLRGAWGGEGFGVAYVSYELGLCGPQVPNLAIMVNSGRHLWNQAVIAILARIQKSAREKATVINSHMKDVLITCHH